MIVLFVAFGLGWGVLPSLVSTTLHRDTIQILYWGQEWELGYFKHPPLISWLNEPLFLLFGPLDVVYYLESVALTLLAFWVVYRFALRYVSPLRSAMAVAALTVMGYFSYVIPALNHNVLLLLPWCLSIVFGYEALEERRKAAWPALGLALGIGILTKYTILLLPLVFLGHVLGHRKHWPLLRDPWVWLGVGLCLLVASPHLGWLVDSEFAPLTYLADSAGLDSRGFAERHLLTPLTNLAMMVGMCGSLLLLMVGALGLPRLQGRPASSAEHYLMAVSFGPAVAVVVLSAISGGEMRVEWATTFFATLPIVLLRYLYAAPDGPRLRRFMVWVAGLNAAMMTTFVLIFGGWINQVPEGEWSRFPDRAVAAAISESWAKVCPGPVPVIVSDSWLAGTASYRLPGRPRVYTEADSFMAPWLSDEDVQDSGGVVVWNMDNPTQFRELDHQEEIGQAGRIGWFPGLEEMGRRFGPLLGLADATFPYPPPVTLPPLRLGFAVIPPAKPCR
ncbi:glycosyltransferase [Paramagnetospirillum marisnigri]|uniref:Glycosyltransferase n=1 Tax=Paramagnetospirillum marisnigri TaxID=1285242 RepID=A0A178MPC8_9PROT|nr:glycosyltransferase [Paramagnetospirillum marisnigri]